MGKEPSSPGYRDLEEGGSQTSSEETTSTKAKGCGSSMRRYVDLVKRREFAYFLPAILVFYSVIKEIKMGEPFVYQLHTQVLNYTARTLNGEIHPYSSYANFLAIIPLLLLTDVLLFKPVMYLEIISQIVYRGTLVFTRNLFSQQFGQASYGVATASEIAFYSYIYGKLDKSQYQRLTSWTRAGTMAGRTGGYVIAQFLLITGTTSYLFLHQVAFTFSCIALIFCFLMPRVSWKSMVDRMRVAQESQKSRAKSHKPLPASYSEYASYRLHKLWGDFIKVYSNSFIRKWSAWWALTTAMALQISLYSQTLFGQAQGKDEVPLNGFADAGYTFTATVAILVLNSLPINWDKWGETALVLISTLDAIFLYIYSTATSAYPMYIVYIFYRAFYQVMITIAQWNIAKKMVVDSYGLVFGVNSFLALILQSLLTRIVTDKRGLGMQVRSAFLVYASLHALIAVIFLCSVIYTVVCHFCNKGKISPANISSKRTTRASRKQSSVKAKPLEGLPSSATVATDVVSVDSTDVSKAVPDRPKPRDDDIASELDFSSSEDETDSDEDKVPGMPTDSLAASFSASMSKKLSKI